MAPFASNRYRKGSDSKGLIERAEPDIPSIPNILVVDDEPSVLEFISTVFGAKGILNDTAQSLQQAEEAVSEKVYDIVFLDVGFPDGSGFSILEKLMRLSPRALVVMITAMNDLETAVQAIRKGAFDYITKPFSVVLFKERLDIIIEEWRARIFAQYYQNSLEQIVAEKTRELNETVHHIDHVYDMTVIALGEALNLRDPETQEHCRRVSTNSVLLGERLGLRGQRLKDLQWGAYLHDIGKIGISEKILSKSGPLSKEEMLVIQKHTILGYSMIKKIDFLKKAGDVILYHHERYDGNGYPLGLEGAGIPFYARIFMVIDAFDAMIVDRPYRKALTYAEALKEIRKRTGTHFDPEIVEKFLGLPESQLAVRL